MDSVLTSCRMLWSKQFCMIYFGPSFGYLINSLYCRFWQNESMDHAHPKCTVKNVSEKWIWWKSDEMIYYVCTADLILHHIGEKLICSYHMSQFFRNSGWRRTTIEDATSADHAYNAWRLADASLGAILKWRPQWGGEGGGWPKSRHSKGGCVDLVLQISPNCGQGGEGVKNLENFADVI